MIKGKYHNNNIESLIKKYLRKNILLYLNQDEYVICWLCKSSNTTLKKDAESRLYNKECNSCHASMSVSTLKMAKKKKD
jgi:translation initiation factor 2 beta subunit (eIF-2beta)/eIF-5